MFKVYLKAEEDSDCSWSVLYVVLGLMCGVLTFFGCTWSLVYICYRWCHSRHDLNQPTNYKLIEDTDDLPPCKFVLLCKELFLLVIVVSSRKGNLSDSDTDSDVVFETRSKPPRFSDVRNGHKPNRNGFGKAGRRVKT